MVSRKRSARSRVVWILLAVCIVLFFVGWTFRAYGKFGDQLSALGGMALGDSRGDIRYKLGIPPIVYGTDETGDAGMRVYYTDPLKDPANALPDGTNINSFHIWSYDNGPNTGNHFDLTFDPRSSRVTKVTCIDQSDPPSANCGRLAGTEVGDSEFRILALLGTPTRQSIDDKLGVKTMEYGDIGAVFFLARQRVFGISVVGTGARKQPPLERFLIWYTADFKTALR